MVRRGWKGIISQSLGSKANASNWKQLKEACEAFILSGRDELAGVGFL